MVEMNQITRFLTEHNIVYFSEVEISTIIPRAKFIFKNEDNNGAYEGKDCEINQVQLYEYDDMYIIYRYSVEGTDLEVSNILDNYDDHEEFVRNAFKFVQKSSFSAIEFADNLPDPSYQSVAEFFHIIYRDEGLQKFTDYMISKYQMLTKRQHI